MRFVRKIVLWLLAIAVLLAGGAVGAFYYAPSDMIRGYAQDAVREQTGRELVIDGEIRRSLFPLGVETGPIRLSNADWAGEGDMFSAKRVSVQVDTAALVGGVVRVKSFELEEPVANLVVSEGGRGNWVMGDRPVGGRGSAVADAGRGGGGGG
ncbi:MAG: AsmA family protein, partial [Pseudomonadota bacterium]